MKILILDNKIQVCFSARESGKKKKNEAATTEIYGVVPLP